MVPRKWTRAHPRPITRPCSGQMGKVAGPPVDSNRDLQRDLTEKTRRRSPPAASSTAIRHFRTPSLIPFAIRGNAGLRMPDVHLTVRNGLPHTTQISIQHSRHPARSRHPFYSTINVEHIEAGVQSVAIGLEISMDDGGKYSSGIVERLSEHRHL